VLGAPTAALGYGDPAGAGELRAALAGCLGRVRGVEAAAAGVLVTAGFAQAVALLARGLPSRLGRAVAVEDPGSPGTREQLAGNGLEPVPVGVDEEGLRVDELARGPARLVVVTATCAAAGPAPAGGATPWPPPSTAMSQVSRSGARRRACTPWSSWATGVDEEELVRRAAVEAGVGLHGLTPWRFGGRGAPGLVLGYASLTEHQIAEGVRRVAPLLTGRR
jgi:DNA-binding transcriptional MocR family regulator